MKTIFYDILIVAGVVLGYIVMAAFQPGVNDIIATVNSSINATDFPDMAAAVGAYPLYSWFIPGLVGVIAIVVNHVRGGE